MIEIGVGRKGFCKPRSRSQEKSLKLERSVENFTQEIPVRKTQKIAPDSAGLLWYCFEDKKGVLRMGYGCNCKKIAGEGGVCWRPEDLSRTVQKM